MVRMVTPFNSRLTKISREFPFLNEDAENHREGNRNYEDSLMKQYIVDDCIHFDVERWPVARPCIQGKCEKACANCSCRARGEQENIFGCWETSWDISNIMTRENCHHADPFW